MPINLPASCNEVVEIDVDAGAPGIHLAIITLIKIAAGEVKNNAPNKNNQNWLFFGGVNGLNYLKSDSLRMRLDVPQVYFTKLY